MPSPITKILLLSASLGLCACSDPSPQNEAKADYNPPAKITASPEPFRPSEHVTFTASIYAPGSVAGTGDNPDSLFLQLIPMDTDGKRDVGDQRQKDKPYPGADSTGWATVTFDAVQPPAAPPGGTLEVNVAYKTWKGDNLGYTPKNVGGPDDLRTVYFRMDCGAKSGTTVAEREGSSLCTYNRQ